MAHKMANSTLQRQVVALLIFLCMRDAVCETLQYSISEEMEIGSFVGNIANDLGLDNRKLGIRKARITSEGSAQYFQLNIHSGDVVIEERIDREILCGQIVPCLLYFEFRLKNPVHFYRAEVQIQDINDNPPIFLKKRLVLKIHELSQPRTPFILESAQDSDIGVNNVQNYTISPNEHFRLDVHSRIDGSKYAELVLEKQLDREEQHELNLLLTAVDGGLPPKSGTTEIKILVLDANDNFPQFSQLVYKVELKENSAQNSLVCEVTATDKDLGSYGEITYSFNQVSEKVTELFKLNQSTGEITVQGSIDFEETRMHEIDIQATDGGGLSAHSKVIVEILDINDNSPELIITSVVSPIPEDSLPGTVVAVLNAKDRDSKENGKTICSIEGITPFSLKSSFKNYYSLVTEIPLDREKVSEYNITIIAMDCGSPSLTSQETVRVQVSDVNDNPPLFSQNSYTIYVNENNNPSLLVGTLNAVDIDYEQNAKITYSLLPDEVGEISVASYVSINPANGNMYALQSLDYEKIRDFRTVVRATDGGSPSLSSNATLQFQIIDENDNPPIILYPVQDGASLSSDLVPRSALADYLVTKVVAVDGDSGQNAWLSYQLQKSTDPSLFNIVEHNGEIRTSRPITERDNMKQKLVIVVRDHGKPSFSTTTILNVLLVDGFSEPYLQFSDLHSEEGKDSKLTVYLVIALVFISFIFLVSMVVFIVFKIIKTRRSQEKYASATGNFYDDSNMPKNLIDVNGTGTLSQSYRYEVCLTTESGGSEFKFLRPLLPNFPPRNETVEANLGINPHSQTLCNPVDQEDPITEVSRRLFAVTLNFLT
ncbi:protocadherin beta-1-like [Microcaecilia unicolor]|uniref:Protocadherin beta-1-like n=1 Tax=Microcaecilia unicolor TaxID=1415580 RepID=A0A6P7Z0I8_9AMPH|nr:protocadherin beta-1-like [Microcaecilia unicolor]